MKLFVVLLGILLPSQMFADDFATAISRYDANQKAISSFVGTGSMNVSMYSVTQGTLIRAFDSNLTLYMKTPDKIRLNISSQGGNIEMVQVGDQMTQRVPGTSTLVTSRVTSSNDLFRRYFNVGISDNIQNVQLLSSGQVTEQGQTLQKFVAKNATSATSNTASALPFAAPDKTEYYFDQNDMLVRVVSTSNGVPVVQTDYSVQKQGNVFVAASIETTIVSQQTKIITTINYTGVSVNTVVADSEFVLK